MTQAEAPPRLALNVASSAIWVMLLTLGSPVLPDARYLKIALIVGLAFYLIWLNSVHTLSTLTVVILILQVTLIIWTIISAEINHTLIVQRGLLTLTAFLCCIALSTTDFMTLQTSFVRASLLVLSFGWLMTLAGKIPTLLASDYQWLGLPYRYSGILDSPNGAGLLAILTLALMYHNTQIRRLFLVIPMLSILGSEYRGGLLSLIGIALWLTVRSLMAESVNKTLFAYLRLSCLGLFAFIAIQRLTVSRTGNGDATTGRSLIWQQCQNYISKQSYLGGGPQFIQHVIGFDENNNNAATGSFQFFHCHNQLLNDTVNFGYVGMLLSNGLLLFTLALAIRRRNTPWQLVPLVFLVAGLFESPINYLAVQSTLWPVALLWSGLIALARHGEPESPVTETDVRQTEHQYR